MQKIDVRQHPLFLIFLMLAIIVIVGIGFFTANLNTIKEESPAVQQAYVTKTISNTSHAISNPTFSPKSTYIYTGENYQAKFPTDWTEDVNTLETTQGKMLTLQPNTSTPDESAHVAVEINSATDVPLSSMSANLTFLGFKKDTTVVGGLAAQKFSGTVTLSQKTLHNTMYLFSYNNQTYLVKLSYVGKYDSLLEQQFTQFVNSFSFN